MFYIFWLLLIRKNTVQKSQTIINILVSMNVVHELVFCYINYSHPGFCIIFGLFLTSEYGIGMR